MSFRDTFTRDSSSSENLPYDDIAAYYFYLTILLIVTLPLLYSLFKSIFNPFSNVPGLAEIEKHRQFRDKIDRFKRQKRFHYISCKFFFKVHLSFMQIAFFTALVYAIVVCFEIIHNSKDQLKGFDPYEILQIEPDATNEQIKKAYRRLALIYHPDRNPNNPDANARFIMITKAYQCFTNDQTKQKCQKHGNPQGTSSFNVGIALPSFLVKKENHVTIMGIVFLILVIILPAYLIHYHSEMNKYDEMGMLTKNWPMVRSEIHQHLTYQNCIFILAYCQQFATLRTTKVQIDKLETLLKLCGEKIRTALLKKNYLNFIRKVVVLLDTRFDQREIPNQLEADMKFIMRKVPLILKSTISIASGASTHYYKGHPNFAGVEAMITLIKFGQYFIQGHSFDSESIRQLDLSKEEFEKLMKKKKNRNTASLAVLLNNEAEREYLFSLLSDNRKAYIKECLDYFPTVELNHSLKIEGQEEDCKILANDGFQVILNIKTNRKSRYCQSNNYPFLKMQSWYALVSDGQFIVHEQNFVFDELEYEIKFKYYQSEKGRYSFKVTLLPDCYYDLEIEKEIKYEIGAAKNNFSEPLIDSPTKETDSIFGSLMKQISLEEPEEESDKQDEQKKSHQSVSPERVQEHQKKRKNKMADKNMTQSATDSETR